MRARPPCNAERQTASRALVLVLWLVFGCTAPAPAPTAPATTQSPGPLASDDGAATDTTADTTDSSEADAGSGAEADAIEDEPEPKESDVALDAAPHPHPLDGWSAEAVRRAVHENLAALGSMSVGQPNAGALINGKQAENSELYELVDPAHAYGTEESLGYLQAALQRVHREFPDSPPLSLGHISARHGGHLSPHVSHQAGRDVDISFFYRDGSGWYRRATERNLDLARTWSFVRALVIETDVEMILIDRSIQVWLRKYALEHGEDARWVDGLFGVNGSRERPIIRHAPGHATHIHIRFYNPIAQETARRAYPALLSEGLVRQPQTFVSHHTKRGETLGMIAKKYQVTVDAIRRANDLRTTRIREGRDYRIPVHRSAPKAPSGAPLKFPRRRLPPTAVLATANADSESPAARPAGDSARESRR